MRQIITVCLDNTIFQVEEDAFIGLRRYLDRARAGLANDPDINEVLIDFERSIAEKCKASLGGRQQPIGLEEVNRILEEMGPVASTMDVEPEPADSPNSAVPIARKLHKQPEGRKISGVCSGLADYLGIDPLFVRIAFVALSFAGGIGVLMYLLLEILMPWPETYTGKRYLVLKLLLVLLAFVTLYVWVNWEDVARSTPFGILSEIWSVLFVGMWIGAIVLIPLSVFLLVAIAAVKYLRTNSRAAQ